MVLRLILVGLVAGLGLSLPNHRDLETLRRSAQRWADARLKEDAPRTPDGAFVFIADETTTTPTPAIPAVAPAQDLDRAPVATVDEVADVPADDASPAETVPPLHVADVPTPAVESSPLDDLLLAAPTEPADEVVETKAVEAMPAQDEAEIDVADIEAEITGAETIEAEVTRVETVEAEATQVETVEAAPVDPDRDFLAVVDEMAATFAEDLALMRDREAEATRLAQAEQEDGAQEVCEDLYPGLAYALNRESEGLDLSSPAPEAPAEPAARLSHAVRLTREAVFAWASLLHGPAVVAISQ